MADMCPKCGYYDFEDGWCGACGFGESQQMNCERCGEEAFCEEILMMGYSEFLCGEEAFCEEIPMMGYSEFLCRECAAAAYRIGEAV